ncbi:MAG TPA: PIN domain-containing protein [Methanomassiliicoccales archaeon]|nr:PIN domain-containing protein [Methanomassiliicoccales archaeon]
MKVVLDTSALFGMEQVPPGWEAFVTEGVLAELEKYNDRRAENLLPAIKVSQATTASLSKVKEAARGTGDSSRLSRTDMEVLALALELRAAVVTDDYSIQNLAAVLGVEFMPMSMKGITKVVRWNYLCTGCGKVFKEPQPDCPVCGSPLRTTRRR